MSKQNPVIAISAIVVLWVSGTYGQEITMKRREPAMKSVPTTTSAPMMKASPPSNAAKTKTSRKKKRTKKAADKRRPTRLEND